jgi:hypothetical protein
MKYTIEGFNQQKMVEYGMDANDAIILRWFVDFYSTNKMVILRDSNGKEFRWVNYKSLIADLPILKINNKEVISRRMRKMAESGILDHWTCKNKGVYSCYNIGENYHTLIDSIFYGNKQGTDSKVERVPTQK